MSQPTVWQYRVTREDGRWLADVVLRSDGFFATVSDYGRYAYWWGSPGKCFRAFLCDVERSPSYLAEKLTTRDIYNGEATLRRIRSRICSWRRDGGMTKEEAAKEWRILGEVICGWMGYRKKEARKASEISEYDFRTWYEKTGISDASECASYGSPPEVWGFTREVMPRLAAMLRAELAAETAQVAS